MSFLPKPKFHHPAIETNDLRLTPAQAFDAILTGYREGLETGGRAFVLAENHDWLRKIATGALREPARFWQKIAALPDVKGPVPDSAAVAMEHVLPLPTLPYEVKHRVAGLGSLGRPRYVAVAEWAGGMIAREAKALLPSSAVWAREGDTSAEIFYQAIVDRAVRCHDPYVQLQGHWIVRRLAPDCSRIELSSLPEERAEMRLLHAMGWETANIHLGSNAAVKAIKQDLAGRAKGWLERAAEAMTTATKEDWTAWKENPL